MNLVRLLRAEDIDSALMLSTSAGWNQTREDWQRLVRISPEGCWCVEHRGNVVATATLVGFGELGWIGMVLAHPAYRRRGLARLLVRALLAHADALGIRTLKLDATESGKPLYQSLGFVMEEAVERLERRGECQSTIHGKAAEGISLAEQMDREAFGGDRRELLRDLASQGTSKISRSGFALTRVGREALYLGPCISESAEGARRLIQGMIESNSRARWYWDLLPSNQAAVALAEESGFVRQRSLCRMRRGEPQCSNAGMIYAIAGFEFG